MLSLSPTLVFFSLRLTTHFEDWLSLSPNSIHFQEHLHSIYFNYHNVIQRYRRRPKEEGQVRQLAVPSQPHRPLLLIRLIVFSFYLRPGSNTGPSSNSSSGPSSGRSRHHHHDRAACWWQPLRPSLVRPVCHFSLRPAATTSLLRAEST